MPGYEGTSAGVRGGTRELVLGDEGISAGVRGRFEGISAVVRGYQYPRYRGISSGVQWLVLPGSSHTATDMPLLILSQYIVVILLL